MIHRSLPHTITTWQTQILCVSPKDGIGFSKTTEITSYQPFFVDVLTPYSIKKGETLYLHVIVFNYLSYNLPVNIINYKNNLVLILWSYFCRLKLIWIHLIICILRTSLK